MIDIEDIMIVHALIPTDQEKTIIQKGIIVTVVDVITRLTPTTLHRVHLDTVVDRDPEGIDTATLIVDLTLVIIVHEDLHLLVPRRDRLEDLLTAIIAPAHRIYTTRDVHLHQLEVEEVEA